MSDHPSLMLMSLLHLQQRLLVGAKGATGIMAGCLSFPKTRKVVTVSCLKLIIYKLQL